MKIGFITPEFPSKKIKSSSGGIGTSIFNLAQSFVKNGHKVILFVYGQPKDEVIEDDGFTFYLIKNVKVKGFSRFFTQKKVQKLINELYAKQGLDIVEVSDWTGFSSFINTKCPLVVRLHGSDTYFCHLDQRPVKWINKFHEQKGLKQADRVVSVSRYTANLTAELFDLDPNEIDVVPNGIDTHKFKINDSIEVEANSILYFGTLIRKKGLLELPHIFNKVIEEVPDAKLILVGRDASDIISGSSSTWELMKPIFSEKALNNVDYKGSVSYDYMQEEIQKASLCVFPSFAEALPVSWLEAMMMKKVLVASDIGWAPEIIQHNQNGFLVSPKDHTNYAKHIIDVLKTPKINELVGQAAQERILNNFEKNIVAQQSIAFYRKVIEDRSSK